MATNSAADKKRGTGKDAKPSAPSSPPRKKGGASVKGSVTPAVQPRSVQESVQELVEELVQDLVQEPGSDAEANVVPNSKTKKGDAKSSETLVSSEGDGDAKSSETLVSSEGDGDAKSSETLVSSEGDGDAKSTEKSTGRGKGAKSAAHGRAGRKAQRNSAFSKNTKPLKPELLAISAAVAPELEPVVESVRYILARPQIAIDRDLPSRIAVVAALPGEGVTTVSSVFSSVLSTDSGAETCRVDLSWGSTAKPGVFEVVMGEAELDDVLDWEGPTAVLHSGGVTLSARHRLARAEELDKLVATLGRRFQHVILDLPAILGGSDGLTMMRLADAYLLVVKHGETTLQQVQTATHQLAGFESLGSVLNQVRIRTPRPLSRWLAG